jgi:NAD(P)-dependent dehydrogenase (short-subunit alcohol dehydrogenase family)
MATVLITGATDGLGRALADRLAADGTTLILHGRDARRLDRAADEIERAYGGDRPRTVLADLAELAQVRRLAAEVREHTERLDVLVSNAGIGGGEPDGRQRRLSAEGYELRFAVNYLAGFLLTLELLPLLRRPAPASSRKPARIVNVASIGQHPLDFDDLMIEHGYSGGRAYGQSKLAQIMSGFELAGQLPATEVTVNSLHPATYMPTKMVLREIGRSVDTLETGVAATYRLVADSTVDGVTGRFFDRTREARANAQAYDGGARGELWKRSLQLTDAPAP